MPYNLIDERWIPVERRSGRVQLIAPAQVVEREDPPVRIASPRPDFDGALLEFLIGLLQTAAAPAREKEWLDWYEHPPGADDLQKRLRKVRDAFNLDGDGPRFMQDLTVDKDSKKADWPIGALLIDRVGETGLSEGPSLFAKPGLIEALSYPAAAAALLVQQTYGPEGGAGKRTSLRGGGPLTTVIEGDDLWGTVWLAVLPRREFEQRVPGEQGDNEAAAIFPWTGKTRTSSGSTGTPTTTKHTHPLQHFWGLPKRIRLVVEEGDVGTCSISGAAGVQVVRGFVDRPHGTNYKGDFRHPLTPYSEVSRGKPWNPKKAGPDGLPYRDWPAVATGGQKRRPAAAIVYFAQARKELRPNARVTAFGYCMKQMEPLRWIRAETPLVTVADACRENFAAEVEALVAASEEVRTSLTWQIRAAWSENPKKKEAPRSADAAYWSATEPAFFAAVHGVKRALEAGDSTALDGAREALLQALQQGALRVFDLLVPSSASLAPAELRRAVTARGDLVRYCSAGSRKLRQILSLPVEDQGGAAKAPKAKKPRKESTK